MNGIHPSQHVVFKTFDGMTHHLRGEIADCSIGHIGHKHGFEVPVLKSGYGIFSSETTKRGNYFRKGYSGEAEFGGLVAPREDEFATLFADVPFDKRRCVEKHSHQ